MLKEDRPSAQRYLERSLDFYKTVVNQGAVSNRAARGYNIAAIEAIRGNKEQAYVWLKKSIDAGGARYYWWTLKELWFENLHGELRFQQMMAGAKAKVDSMRARVLEKGWL